MSSSFVPVTSTESLIDCTRAPDLFDKVFAVVPPGHGDPWRFAIASATVSSQSLSSFERTGPARSTLCPRAFAKAARPASALLYRLFLKVKSRLKMSAMSLPDDRLEGRRHVPDARRHDLGELFLERRGVGRPLVAAGHQRVARQHDPGVQLGGLLEPERHVVEQVLAG